MQSMVVADIGKKRENPRSKACQKHFAIPFGSSMELLVHGRKNPFVQWPKARSRHFSEPQRAMRLFRVPTIQVPTPLDTDRGILRISYGPSNVMGKGVSWTFPDSFLHLEVIVHGVFARAIGHKEQAADQYQDGHDQIGEVHASQKIYEDRPDQNRQLGYGRPTGQQPHYDQYSSNKMCG